MKKWTLITFFLLMLAVPAWSADKQFNAYTNGTTIANADELIYWKTVEGDVYNIAWSAFITELKSDMGFIDWTADQGATNINAANFPASFNVPTLIQSFVPQTYNYTESGNITGITSTWVNLNDTGAAGAKTLDVQDATSNDKYIFYAASGQSVANPLTINMGDTTCTNCPAGGFILTEPGQRVELYWNTSIYTVLWPITSIDIAVPVPNIADPDTWTITTNYGHYTGNAAGSVTLVAFTIYDSILFDTEGTGKMTIDPLGTNHIYLNGVDCGEGVAIESSETTGDTVVIKYRTSTTGSAKGNGFTCVGA